VLWQRAIGAYQVANHCRMNNISCQVIDFTDMFSEKELETTLSKFVNNDTLAIGLSTTFYSDRNKKKYVSTTAKYSDTENCVPTYIRNLLLKFKLEKKIKIIAGGAKSYTVKSDGLFDAVFHGYSEQSVVNYLKDLFSRKKTIYKKINNVDNIDGNSSHFDISELNHNWSDNDCILPKETLSIEISRGCIFKCKFCSYPLNGKKKFDYLRDPLLIRDEMLENYEKYQTTNYYLTDDTFNDSTYKLEQLHKVFTDLPFKLKFVTYLRLDLIHAHKEQIQLLKEMGLGSCFFGIESLTHNTAKIIGKGMESQKIKEFLSELYIDHWEEKIPFSCSFIVGLPGETKEMIHNNWNWISTKPFQDLWFPLNINQTAYYKSDFDIDFKKYGYRLDQNGDWISDIMNYKEACDIAENLNFNGLYGNKPPASWFLFSLLSHGYGIEDFKTTPAKDLPIKKFYLEKRKMFRQYQDLIDKL
jgi:radical SAM superfamily enzyme YgiQ (UPF0313 family)